MSSDSQTPSVLAAAGGSSTFHAGGGIVLNNNMHLGSLSTPSQIGQPNDPMQGIAQDSEANLRVNLTLDAPPPSELYARLLMPKHHGYPLWDPKPMDGAPRKHREVGVRIGDVGRITPDGSFDFFFNICLPSDDEINANGVPENFEHIGPPSDTERKMFTWRPGARLVNGSVKAVQSESSHEGFNGVFSFVCQAEEGAALTLPEGGVKETLNRVKRFFDYAAIHARSWYKFAIETMERDVLNGSIYLVTGYAKAKSWGTAAWSGVVGEGSFRLKFSTSADAAADANFPFVWAHQSFAATQEGPPVVDPSERSFNQCIFLRGYSVALPNPKGNTSQRTVNIKHVPQQNDSTFLQQSSPPSPGTSSRLPSLFTQLFSGSSGRGSSDSDADNDVSFFPIDSAPRDFSHHPSYELNQYLLKQHPSAEVAITHDDVWMSVISQVEQRLPSFPELLKRICRRNWAHFDTETGTAHFVAFKSDSKDPAPTSLDTVEISAEHIYFNLPLPSSRKKELNNDEDSNKYTQSLAKSSCASPFTANPKASFQNSSQNSGRLLQHQVNDYMPGLRSWRPPDSIISEFPPMKASNSKLLM